MRRAGAGLFALAVLAAPAARAQDGPPRAPGSSQAAGPVTPDADVAAPYGSPIGDRRIYVHGLFDELEGRLGAEDSFRWEGEAWVGDDQNRLWLKSEGEVTRARVSDGQQEAFYDRPITPYFDLQVGGRYDLDSFKGRGWAALGVEGFAPYYATVSATLYASGGGHFAAKLQAADEIRFTQRLILEPQAELNLYSEADPARRIGSGVSSLDAGLRLRYELARKLAPYLGVTYEAVFGRTADDASAAGDRTDDLRLTLGVRSWF